VQLFARAAAGGPDGAFGVVVRVGDVKLLALVVVSAGAHLHDSGPITARTVPVPYFWPQIRPLSTSPHIHGPDTQIHGRHLDRPGRTIRCRVGTRNLSRFFNMAQVCILPPMPTHPTPRIARWTPWTFHNLDIAAIICQCTHTHTHTHSQTI
jgi:hypothetical protein